MGCLPIHYYNARRKCLHPSRSLCQSDRESRHPLALQNNNYVDNQAALDSLAWPLGVTTKQPLRARPTCLVLKRGPHLHGSRLLGVAIGHGDRPEGLASGPEQGLVVAGPHGRQERARHSGSHHLESAMFKGLKDCLSWELGGGVVAPMRRGGKQEDSNHPTATETAPLPVAQKRQGYRLGMATVCMHQGVSHVMENHSGGYSRRPLPFCVAVSDLKVAELAVRGRLDVSCGLNAGLPCCSCVGWMQDSVLGYYISAAAHCTYCHTTVVAGRGIRGLE